MMVHLLLLSVWYLQVRKPQIHLYYPDPFTLFLAFSATDLLCSKSKSHICSYQPSDKYSSCIRSSYYGSQPNTLNDTLHRQLKIFSNRKTLSCSDILLLMIRQLCQLFAISFKDFLFLSGEISTFVYQKEFLEHRHIIKYAESVFWYRSSSGSKFT
jgi:hypothetical protein